MKKIIRRGKVSLSLRSSRARKDGGKRERWREGDENEHIDSIEIELVVQGEHLGSESRSFRGGGHGGGEVADQRATARKNESERRERERSES